MEFENGQKQTILIVDDSEMNRSILADMLGEEYDILEAEDGVQALAALQKYGLGISLVLLDNIMPHMTGFEVLDVMNQKHWIEDIPVIMISAESDSSQVARAYELGVTDFIARPFDTLIVRRRAVNTIFLYAKQKKLVGMLADQIEEKERQSSMMVDILSHIVEFRNGESGQHIVHVRTLTGIFLRQFLRWSKDVTLTQEEISLICTASALHDIGKIAIDESILNKPGRLTPEEFEVMKTHSAIGAEMLKSLPAYKDEPLVRTAYEICRWHHERYDGRGYPDGLKGDEIPISAQIVALADVYDALTSERCYKKALPHDTAVQMILDGQCGAFNPVLMDCLREAAPTLQEELAAAAQPQTYRPEVRRIASGKDLEASERSLRLLDHERMKYNFFAAMTEEIQFEYTVTPSMLTLSEWGADKLGLDEVILDPWENEAVLRVLGDSTRRKLAQMLRETTPEHPVITYECQLQYSGQPRWHRFVARAMWSTDDPPVYTGSIGKFVDIHDAWIQLRELEDQVSRDDLTGLLNQTYAKKQIQAEIDRDPTGTYLLAILNLDQFEAANDRYGRLFGNRVLRYVADKLRQNTGEDDVVARIDGDAFLLFLKYKTDAAQAVDRILTAVTGDYDGLFLSASMGVAETRTVGYGYDDLFHAADQALCSIRREDRGQYRMYDDSLRETLSGVPARPNEKGEREQ